MSLQRRDRRQRDRRHESGFVAGVTDGEIEVDFRWHLEEWYLDGTQLDVATKAGRFAYVVAFPGPHLQNQVVSVGAGEEVGTTRLKHLLEISAILERTQAARVKPHL